MKQLFHYYYKQKMPFRPEQLRAAIGDGSTPLLLGWLKKLIYSLRHDHQQMFLMRAIEELANILKDQGQSPVLKFKSIKILIYLILLADPLIYLHFQDVIYPMLRNACLFNRSQPLATRGQDFFRNNKYSSIANYQEKAKIKNIGCRYIIFCLECVSVLAQWLPNDSINTKQQSLYNTSYRLLLKDGVIFPKQQEYIFFSEQRMKQIQSEIKICCEQVQKMNSDIDSQYFESVRSRSDAQMMNGVQYLQKRLKQKEKKISQLKYTNSINDLQKHSAVEKLKQKQNNHINKIQLYQAKIAELTQQVRDMRTNYRKIEQKQQIIMSDPKDLQIIANLQSQIRLLIKQNQELKRQNSMLIKRSQKGSSNSLSKQLQNLDNSKATTQRDRNNYIKELLQVCNEPNQFCIKNQVKAANQQQFYQHKEAKQFFLPFFDSLSKEQQIRLRKALLKSKQIIYKSKTLEVGTITTLTNDIQVQIALIITNLSQFTLNIQNIKFDHTNQLVVHQQTQNRTKRKLKAGQQFRQQLKVIVNNIDSRCIVMLMEYHIQQSKIQNLALLLPVSKYKLIKILSYTSFPNEGMISIERVFTKQKKLLTSMQKIKDYFPKCFVQNHYAGKQYHLKIQFLQTIIFVSLNELGDDQIRIMIRSKSQNRILAEKVMSQFKFILGK